MSCLGCFALWAGWVAALTSLAAVAVDDAATDGTGWDLQASASHPPWRRLMAEFIFGPSGAPKVMAETAVISGVLAFEGNATNQDVASLASPWKLALEKATGALVIIRSVISNALEETATVRTLHISLRYDLLPVEGHEDTTLRYLNNIEQLQGTIRDHFNSGCSRTPGCAWDMSRWDISTGTIAHSEVAKVMYPVSLPVSSVGTPTAAPTTEAPPTAFQEASGSSGPGEIAGSGDAQPSPSPSPSPIPVGCVRPEVVRFNLLDYKTAILTFCLPIEIASTESIARVWLEDVISGRDATIQLKPPFASIQQSSNLVIDISEAVLAGLRLRLVLPAGAVVSSSSSKTSGVAFESPEFIVPKPAAKVVPVRGSSPSWLIPSIVILGFLACTLFMCCVSAYWVLRRSQELPDGPQPMSPSFGGQGFNQRGGLQDGPEPMTARGRANFFFQRAFSNESLGVFGRHKTSRVYPEAQTADIESGPKPAKEDGPVILLGYSPASVAGVIACTRGDVQGHHKVTRTDLSTHKAPRKASRSPRPGQDSASREPSRSPGRGADEAPRKTSRSPRPGRDSASREPSRSPGRGRDVAPRGASRSPRPGTREAQNGNSRSPHPPAVSAVPHPKGPSHYLHPSYVADVSRSPSPTADAMLTRSPQTRSIPPPTGSRLHPSPRPGTGSTASRPTPGRSPSRSPRPHAHAASR